MADELHSRKDNELEEKDQNQFAKALVMAGVAMLVIFVVALLVVRWAGRRIQPVNPDKHPTSELLLWNTAGPSVC
jgi:hypothetical protein